jgi:hypothetical protein
MPRFGHSTGRRDTGYRCPHLEKRLKQPVPPEHAALYREAMETIDSLLPHLGDRTDTVMHGIPAEADLREIEAIESALKDLAGIEVHTSALYRHIQAVEAKRKP